MDVNLHQTPSKTVVLGINLSCSYQRVMYSNTSSGILIMFTIATPSKNRERFYSNNR